MVPTYPGVYETNSIDDFAGQRPEADKLVHWSDPELAKITRLRLLSDPGYPYWDVSYIWGELNDGTAVRVQNPFDELRKNKLTSDILEAAKRDGVYAKGLGVFNAISKLC